MERIYKVISFSKKDLLCLKANISDYIIPYDRKTKSKGEIGWDNKSTSTMDGDVTIKDICIKLNVDRLGNIKPFSNTKFYTKPSHQPDEAKEENTSYFKSAKINTFHQSEERMLIHTSNMNPEERMAYLQQLRETTQSSNLSEDEKTSILSKFKINPTDENS